MTSPLYLPDPPAPGASTRTYSYEVLGPHHNIFASVFDETSTSSGVAGGTTFLRYLNPLRWFGKIISYTNETRWFNTFRAERNREKDEERETAEAQGQRRVRRRGAVCWEEELYRIQPAVRHSYIELVRFERWTINLSKEAYYEFFTGFGGVTVDVAIDGAAIGAAAASEALAAQAVTSSAVAAAANAVGTTGGLSAAAAAGTATEAAAITGAAARFMGLAG